MEPHPETLNAFKNKNKKKKKEEEEGDVICVNQSHNNAVKEGDIVWAEAAFRKTWWPGRINSVENRGSSVRVSFFDSSCKKNWFWVSEIKPFEEFYRQCRKETGTEVANAVNLAFEEMNRRTVLSLNCCVRNGNASANEGEEQGEIGRIRERFQPVEVSKFVRDLGKNAFVAEDQIIQAVRVCSEIYAFNRYRSLPSKVTDDYSSSEILGITCAKAVNVCNKEDEVSDDLGVMNWIMEYRDFTSVCPRWIYRPQNEEIEQLSDRSEDENIEDEIPDLLYSSDLKNTANISLEGPEICTLNRIDFGFFDSDEESCEKGNLVNPPSDKPDTLEEEIDVIIIDDHIVTEESCKKGIPVNLPSHEPDSLDEQMDDDIIIIDEPRFNEESYKKGNLVNLPSHKPYVLKKHMDDVITNYDHVINSPMKKIGKKRKGIENESENNFVKLQKSRVKNPERLTNSNKNPNYPYHDQNALHIPDFSNKTNNLSHNKEGSSKPKPKLLCIKFPMDYKIPSKEELEKLFGVFGLLDGTKTRVFLWLAEVVFLKHKEAMNAFEQLKRKNIFRDVNVKVRFQFDEYESFKVGSKSAGVVSSLGNNVRKREKLYLESNKIRREVIKNYIKARSKGLKSCMKNPNSGGKKKVRFSL